MTVAGARPLRATDPTSLGGIELIGRLGEGGMGVVYLGVTSDAKRVAVKAIRADLADEPDFRRRFRGEVNRARQVPPYCTAEVLGADPDSDPPYLVVEYVDGPSLADVVGERGPFSSANLHSVAIGVATALTAIHGAGVIHRDLKPANVLLAPGSLKVIDFGIARPVEDASTLTDANEIVGTVAYMAPERFGPDANKSLTPAADVFAWGAVVAFAGTGRVPFKADSMPGVAVRILHDEPDLDGLPEQLRELVAYALAKEPADRPTARQLLDLLTSADGARTPVSGRPPRPPVPAPVPAGPTVPRTRPDVLAAPPPGRRRGVRGILAGASAALLTLALAVAIATGVVRLPFLHPLADASTPSVGTTASASQQPSASPSATAAPSASPSASLSGSPSSAAPPTWAQVLAGLHQSVADPLTAVDHWSPSSANGGKLSCAIGSTGMVAMRALASSYRCLGPLDLLYDTAVSVDVTLLDTASCAGIWVRFDTAGYATQICPEGIYLVAHGSPTPTSVTKVCDPIPAPMAAGTVVTIGVALRGSQFSFYRNGQYVGGCADDSHTFAVGHVALGIFPRTGLSSAAPSSQVRLRNVKIYGSTG